jgi:hypothetical protein
MRFLPCQALVSGFAVGSLSNLASINADHGLRAKYLRQTILMSRYDTPEARALFHKHCFNLQGKLRLEKNDYKGVLGRTRPGVKQIYQRVDQEVGVSKGVSGDAAAEEVDMRLDWFVKKVGFLISGKW